jgi:hypothetical protein
MWEPLDRDRICAVSDRRDYNAGEVGEKASARRSHAIDATKNPSQAISPRARQRARARYRSPRSMASTGDDEIDLLVVSLSAHDYIGRVGTRVRGSLDAERVSISRSRASRVARSQGRHMGDAATSDHGASPLPELVGGGGCVTRSLPHAPTPRRRRCSGRARDRARRVSDST